MIQERRVGLSQFVQALTEHDSLCSDPEVCAFFKVDVVSQIHRDASGMPANWIAALQPTPEKRDTGLRVLSSAEKLKEHRRVSELSPYAESPERDQTHFGGMRYEIDERDTMPVLSTPKGRARWFATIDADPKPGAAECPPDPNTKRTSNPFDHAHFAGPAGGAFN